MKKAISLLLALVMCLSLCACGGGNDTLETKGNEENNNTTEHSIDILGEWVWVGDNTNSMTFNENNTCLYSNGDSVKYSVDTALAIITLYDDTTKNYDIVEENGVVKLSGNKVYVRAEDYEAAHSEYLAAEEAKKEERIQTARNDFYSTCSEGRTELQINTTYVISDAVNMTINDVIYYDVSDTYGEGIYHLYLKITLENTSDEQLLLMSKNGTKSDIFTIDDCYGEIAIYNSDPIPAQTLCFYQTPGVWVGEKQYLEANASYECYMAIGTINFNTGNYFEPVVMSFDIPLSCAIIHLNDTEYFYEITDLVILPE